jgi:hypothetical protein
MDPIVVQIVESGWRSTKSRWEGVQLIELNVSDLYQCQEHHILLVYCDGRTSSTLVFLKLTPTTRFKFYFIICYNKQEWQHTWYLRWKHPKPNFT